MQIRRGIKPGLLLLTVRPSLRAVQIRRGIKHSLEDASDAECLRAVQIRRGIKLFANILTASHV